MAGKATSIYITVTVKGDPFAVVAKKKFFNSKECREWLKSVEEDYPADQFKITRETY